MRGSAEFLLLLALLLVNVAQRAAQVLSRREEDVVEHPPLRVERPRRVRARHDGPSRHTAGFESSFALIFNCYKAKFEVVEGNPDQIPTAQSYVLMSAGHTRRTSLPV